MGSRLYDFLGDSFLFDDRRVADEFRTVSDDEIRAELQRYAEFSLNEAEGIDAEIVARTSPLKMLSGTTVMLLETLVQGALYLEQMVVNDPLYQVASSQGPWRAETILRRDIPADNPLHPRQRLLEAVRYLRDIMPMVAADYVKPVPQGDRIGVGIPYAQARVTFEENLPLRLQPWFFERAEILSEDPRRGMTWMPFARAMRSEIWPRLIRFKGDEPNSFPFPVVLNDQGQPLEEGHRFEFPEGRRYTQHSVEIIAAGIIRRTLAELDYAEALQVEFFARSPFIFEMVEQLGRSTADSVKRRTIHTLSDMVLPFLPDLDPATLMRVRMEEGEAFHAWREELEKQLRDLVMEQDEARRRIRLQNIVHEITEVQLPRVAREIKSLRQRWLPDAAVATIGLTTAVISPDLMHRALGVAGIVAGVGSAIADQRATTRRNPFFFLWKSLDRSKKKPKILRDL